jgi:hypothetical protein
MCVGGVVRQIALSDILSYSALGRASIESVGRSLSICRLENSAEIVFFVIVCARGIMC